MSLKNKKDVVLLAIAYARGEGLSPVQLQKTLFLLGKSGLFGLPGKFYEFYPYNYGPFDPNVYKDADALVRKGMVATVQTPSQTWQTYVVTPTGQDYVSTKVKRRVDTQLLEYVQAVVDWVKSLSFNELLRAIYAKYPEFRKNSVFQG